MTTHENVLRLIVQGLPNESIAATLKVDVRSVSAIRARLLNEWVATAAVNEELWSDEPLEVVTSRATDEENRRCLAEIAESSPDFIATAEVDGRIRYLNRTARILTGNAPDAHTEDLAMRDLYADEARSILEDVAIPYATQHGSWMGRLTFRPEGNPMPMSHELTSHKDLKGQLAFWSIVARDDSEREKSATAIEQANATLQAAAKHFERLFHGLPIACISYAADGLVREWNLAAERMFGIGAAEVYETPIWKVVNARCGVKTFKSLLKPVLKGRDTDAIELTVRLKDGTDRIAIASTIPMLGRDGSVISALSAFVDVTDQRRAVDRLAASERRLLSIAGSLHEGLIVQDASGGVLLANASAERILGTARNRLMRPGTKWNLANCVDDAGNAIPASSYPAATVLASGQPTFGVRMGLTRPKKPVVWLNVNAVPVTTEATVGDILTVMSFSDISSEVESSARIKQFGDELQAANRELERLAATDGLTGLRNRRTFDAFLDREFAKAARYDRPMSLLILDIDRFKQMNDDFGHQVGDEVLKRLATVLQETARETDFPARYGGEEFAVVLPECDADSAVEAAERLRASIESSEWPGRPVTASFGVSTFSKRMSRPAKLIEEADKALYESKNAGRNRVTHFNARRRNGSARAA